MLGSGLGGPAACSATDNNPGSGGLYSTGDDMVIWLRHNMDADPVRWPGVQLAHAVYRQRQALTSAIGFDEAGPMGGIGLAWIMSPAHGHVPAIMQKSGASGGFMSYVAFAPGRNVGVFVVVNRLDFAMFAGLTEGANDIIANLVTR
jgi:D-alanyl-D-alanine-carboxypeptidase/D-alanyl-D-alanine-endopeptidase